MPVDGLAGVILAALGVCVLAVIVVLLLSHILSSAPVLELRQWFESLPSSPYPCSCGELRDSKG
jgi:chromate transport protein ChrA